MSLKSAVIIIGTIGLLEMVDLAFGGYASAAVAFALMLLVLFLDDANDR